MAIMKGVTTRASGHPVGSMTLHARIDEQISQRGDARAIICGAEQISYRQLGERANQIAHRLRKMGAAEGKLVAIAMDRSIDMIVGLLGILKSGAAYLPIDLNYPVDRITFILSDAAPVALLTQSASRASLTESLPTLILDDESLAIEPTSVPTNDATGDSLAYVIYTSGSTGMPKGCQVTHTNVVRLFDATDNWFGFGVDDVWTFFHSFAFDFSVWEIWGALIYGGSVVVVPYVTSRSPKEFLRLLVQSKVTVLNQTPSAFRSLVEADRESELPHGALTLRYVIFGGEALGLQTLKPWFDKYGDQKPRLINMYGITETTVHVTYRPIGLVDVQRGKGSVIGVPIPDLQLWLLDENLSAVPTGNVGEIYVSGAGVCRGYLNRDDLTSTRFVDWTPPQAVSSLRLYKTGDLAQRDADGELVYLGRSDHQVKIKGFRIETGEIESQLTGHAGVRSCAVIARQEEQGGEPRLIAYVVPAGEGVPHHELRSYLATKLPEFMLPALFVNISALPLTENGKLDRRALPAPAKERPELANAFIEPGNELERSVCETFAELLGFGSIGVEDSFFELGGGSLLAIQALDGIKRRTGLELGVGSIFAHPTPRGLGLLLSAGVHSESVASKARAASQQLGLTEPVAIVGMAGRFPGAQNIEDFWSNLLQGRDSITRFSPDSLDPSVSKATRDDPDYVWARGIIEGVEDFDAAFFSMPPREAEVTDPQQRIFLEISWECLERAGYAPDRTSQTVGVFAGAGTASYLQNNVLHHPEAIDRVGALQVQLANDKDYIASRVAYKLNLKGPAVNVNTACSSSLVAVAQAVDALRLGRCRMALAGAASITSPPRTGYLVQDGAMLSNDGQTRSFDSRAQGTVFNDGAAVVLLKLLAHAVADGDEIFAVIRGAAINNDGGGKASFSAPSVDGQAAVIDAALHDAGIAAREISYLEAHGTATPLGDPVEVEALTRAFRLKTSDTGFCRIGSVKSNVGHLVAASGAAGLIKTALALHTERLPASINFSTPNPRIDFATSPFVVNDKLNPWPRETTPRRAGVSSFGVGGTNAHVILEEAPLRPASEPGLGPQLLLLSARSQPALDAMARDLADHLAGDTQLNLADVAHTLQEGRSMFSHRLCVVADGGARAAAALRTPADTHRAMRIVESAAKPLVWLFPGQGAQYAGMGRGLYAVDAAFREAFEEAMAAMADALSFDLKTRMFDPDASALLGTGTTQPAMFCLEYSLARAWMARGVRPAALIGHSVGEFAAAVLGGIMSLADAARLVALRGKLMQALPAGGMVAVRLSGRDVRDRLPSELSLAADNGPKSSVVAGPTDAIEAWSTALAAEEIGTRVLRTSHAFHSAMMDPVLHEFEQHVKQTRLSEPKIPIVSTLTGSWMSKHEAVDPRYWARHMREPVLFSPAIRTTLDRFDPVFLELGPRDTLSALARQHVRGGNAAPVALPTLADSPESEAAQWMLAFGQLWTLGQDLATPVANPPASRRRVRLPTYAFQRRRLWLDAKAAESTPADLSVAKAERSNIPTPTLDNIVSVPTISHLSSGLNSMTSAITSSVQPVRRLTIGVRLRELFEDVTGVDLTAADGAAGFLELGLDSLSLTQAALQVKKAFKIPVTFRQLMETYRSFDVLAEYLDSSLPPEAAPAPAPAAAPAQVTTSETSSAPAVAVMPTPALATIPLIGATVMPNGNAVHALIQQQMHLMTQQLALLSGSAATNSAVLPVPLSAPVQPAVSVQPAAVVVEAVATPGAPTDTGTNRYDVKKAFGAIARIHTQKSDLTARQRNRLDTFIRRYTGRTLRSREYTIANRAQLADPRVVNGFRPMTKEITYQIVVSRSKGSRVWDLDGNEYIDVLNGFGMNMFGWQPEFVQTAVREQLELGYEIGPQHPLAGEVASLVCELTGFDRVGLCNTGSEAVMAAIRIARTVTGRNTVVLFTGSYHGTFDEVLVRAGRGGKGIPAAPGIMAGMFGDVRVLDYGTPEALEYIRNHAEDLAAVLVEPVQSRRPEFQPREFLKEVRAITEKNGVCFIFDEVITGFRTALGGVQSLFDIRADLACYGKVIGGGFPVGVVAGNRSYMDSLDGGPWQFGDESMPTVGVTYFAGTFVRHPLALAAAKASLLHLRENGNELQQRLNAMTEAFALEINAFCREVGAPLEIKYFSSLWRVSWKEDHPLQDLLFAMMRSRGVHILDNFPCFMTTAHTPDDVETVKKAFRDSVAECQEADFLPRRTPLVAVADASRPPVPGARLGRDQDGKPAWYVPDTGAPGKFVKVS
jgi:amino acid adenylation domain-containing protein